MVAALSERLVPDELWEVVAPLLPVFRPRPQGGGTEPAPDRAVFTAVVFVLTSGCAWRHLPTQFGVSPPTAHRRFQAWTRAGLWPRLHLAVLGRVGSSRWVHWSLTIVDAAEDRMKGIRTHRHDHRAAEASLVGN